MITKYIFLLLGLFFCLSPIVAQDILQDIGRLQALIPDTEVVRTASDTTIATGDSTIVSIDTTRVRTIRPETLDTVLAILALYGQPNPGEELIIPNTLDVLNEYRGNPFIYPILSQEAVWQALFDHPVDPASLQELMQSFRNSDREHILKQFSANEVYNNDRMLNVSILQSEYATPPVQQQEALLQQTKLLQESVANTPASLTSNILFGLSDWVAKRAQEEFVYTFLTRLQNDLEEKKIKYLFPSTSEYLGQLDVMNYRSILSSAQAAFAKDLRTLSLNVSNYLYKANKLPEFDPAVFNFLLLYRSIDLAQKGTPLEEILGYARGEMNRRRFETAKSMNLQLGKGFEHPAFTDLQTMSEVAIRQLDQTYFMLEGEELALLDSLELAIDFTDSDSFPAIAGRIEQLFTELEAVKYDQLFQVQDRFFDEAVPLLGGSLPYARMKNRPSVDIFEEKFLAQGSPADSTSRAIGLSIIRHLLRTQSDTVAVLHSLNAYYDKIKTLRDEIILLQDTLRVQATSFAQKLEASKVELKANLDLEYNYWAAVSVEIAQHDKESLDYLRRLLSDLPALRPSEEKAYVDQLKALTAQQVDYLNTKYSNFQPSPLMEKPMPIEVDSLQLLIDATSDHLADLHTLLFTADTTLVSLPLRQSYNNAARFETILDALSQFMYCLYMPQDSAYINLTHLNSLLSNEQSHALFLGLIYQRISQLPDLGRIAPEGIATISNSLVQGLADYGQAPDSTSTQAVVNKVQFISKMLNLVLETPLFFKGDVPNAQSFQEMIPAFRKVPTINRELTELFSLSAKGEYRYAVNHIINLVDQFNAYPEARKKLDRMSRRLDRAQSNTSLSGDQQRNRIQKLEAKIERFDTTRYDQFRDNLFRYSHFIADVTSADSPEQIEAAIQNIALPKGSSQNKRKQRSSLELNAYFGGSVGYEKLLNPNLDDAVNLNSFSLFVPVGLSKSWRLSYQSEFSLSIFVPILDLGALTAYRTDPNNQGVERLPDVRFANVIAPGAHVLFNFGKTPFFMGVGLQYGPNTRKINLNDAAIEVEAIRYMLSFGIDVPLLNFGRATAGRR